MIRHTVLLKLTDSATNADTSAIIAALGTLPEQIPDIRDYRFGLDAGLAEGNYDVSVTADFEDPDGYMNYATHPAHLKVIEDHIAPVLAGRVAAQIEI